MKVKNKRSLWFAYILKNKFVFLLGVIIFIGLLLRFYNFPNRWGLGNDDARDIAIARVALERHELPMIGSFSSAGPFVIGPLFYWFIMLSYTLFPIGLISPWIVVAMLSVVHICIAMKCGYLIGGRIYAVIAGILTATAPDLVGRAFSLANNTPIPFITSLLLLFLLLFYKSKKIIYAFLLAFCIGVALTLHYQAINLCIFLSAFLFIQNFSLKKRLITAVTMFGGILIPNLPLLIWDSQQQFANIRNILDYFLIAQYRIYVPNSWKLLIFTYIPDIFSQMTGGYPIIIFLLLSICAGIVVLAMLRKRISREIIIISVSFLFLIILNRYYRGIRAEGYLLYFSSPLIIILTWSVAQFFDKRSALYSFNISNKLLFTRICQSLGIVLLMVTLIGNFKGITYFLEYRNNIQSAKNTISYLTQKYPGKKFIVFDYKGINSNKSQSLAVLLDEKHLIADDGYAIGISCGMPECPQHNMIQSNTLGTPILDLSGQTAQIKKSKLWNNANPHAMYDSLIGWSNKHELQSPFSITRYLQSKISRQ